MAPRKPVTDWATDWDHLDPAWKENPFPIWDDLRARCPIAHTDRYNGAYLPTRYKDVQTIANDTQSFSSRRVVIRETYVEGLVGAPPITSDPPEHKPFKQLLLPAFTAEAVEKLVPSTRASCNQLIDSFIAKGGCDAAQDYAKFIPIRVIAKMLGIPDADNDKFIRWIHLALEAGITDPEALKTADAEMSAYFAGHVAKCLQNPSENLISYLLTVKLNDQPLTPRDMQGILRLILVAGIDTTWSAIGASLWHLAGNPADRDRLIAEPGLMAAAVEEFLRAFSPVTMAREVVKDTTVGGCPVKAGNMLLLSFPAANRDPTMFKNADKVVLDRQPNRHSAFGLGIHRCIGSNLARMEITVALEEWLKRIPKFALDGAVGWSDGTVRGPRKLPIRFPA